MSMIDPRGEPGDTGDAGGRGAADATSQWCALCGSQYVAGVAECAECLVPLVDKPPLASDDVGDDDGEQIAYEYEDLDAENRFAIDRVLTDAGVVHAWEGTTLVVAPYDEDEVDRLLDAAADEAPADLDDAILDTDEEQLVYDLQDWSADQRTDLDGRLEAGGIAHAFDEHGDLVVLVADEERVDALIDAVEFPDQLEADDGTDDGGGLDAVDTLGRLFVATDRLVHDPSDTDGTLDAVDAARALADMGTPFGFGPPVWSDLVERAGALRELLETEAELVDDEAVHEAASRLRAALRQYV